MSRKKRVCRDDIISAGVEVIRFEGESNFTARKVANYLGASTQPIYNEFSNLFNLKETIMENLVDNIKSKINSELKNKTGLKSLSVSYLKWAVKEPNLNLVIFIKNHDQLKDLHQFIIKSLYETCQNDPDLQNVSLQSIQQFFWPSIYGKAGLYSQSALSESDQSFEEIVDQCISRLS